MMQEASHTSVVLGATGGAGRAVVRELATRGHAVRAVSRSEGAGFPDGVELCAADCSDAMEAEEACRDADIVFNCMNIPYEQWPEMLPVLTENAIAAAATAGARLVMLDNLYAYGPVSGPMTEETPRQPPGPKGKLRAQLEGMLLRAHESGRIRVAIGRASDFYGPGANSVTSDLVFEAALDGKTAAWLGSLDAPHTMSYLPDVAWGLATLAAREEAFGEIWHLPSNEPIRGRDFIEKVYDQVGKEPKMRAYGYWALTFAGLFDAQVREVRELLYQFQDPFVMDTSKFEDAFGGAVTSYDQAISETLDWHRRQRQ